MLQHKALVVIAVALLLLVSPFFLRSAKTTEASTTQDDGGQKWEYLVVSAPSSTNFSPSGNARMAGI